ncbi:hypothetical protein Clow_01333 [Corynebacterium lowii]|uniref:Uncharacterized protein n=1 Tax=Corynebacterium lowii TaxID=1544413 RepID=A0A0Q0UJK7_9CORY|nr:hypothetical protein Clow_01333 [Corynebacterium lowii]MDP9850898.1 hypothetical protein [Corynebacterium lowii]
MDEPPQIMQNALAQPLWVGVAEGAVRFDLNQPLRHAPLGYEYKSNNKHGVHYTP